RALRAEGSFDVVHGYWVDPAGLVAAVAGRRLHVPVVVTCDSGEFVSLPSIGYGLQRTVRGRSVVTLACRWATAVHVTSAHMAQLAAAQRIDATCIPLGVEC